ncbi:MAG: iron ABC transporter permease [Hydrogenibacillus sp.]|nr:iron ABC transporter permease [Hydrogenibacillus sp.]
MRRLWALYAVGVSAAMLAVWAGLAFGAVRLGEAVRSGTLDVTIARTIFWELRAPRVTLAFVVGAALALAGTVLQAVFRNPLAEPYTLGVSGGAAFGAALYFVVGTALSAQKGAGWSPGIVGFALSGAIVALFFVERLSTATRSSSAEGLILAGAAVSAFFGALVSLTLVFAGEELRAVVFWLFGSVAGRDWAHVAVLGALTVLASGYVYVRRRALDALTLGDLAAEAVGVDVRRTRRELALAASVLAAGTVATSGVIGFVGLIVPHVVRRLGVPVHRHLLPLSMLYGGIFLVTADLLSRLLLSPRELPLGVVTSLVGAPVFAAIVVRDVRRSSF